jgi:hypothetical protein
VQRVSFTYLSAPTALVSRQRTIPRVFQPRNLAEQIFPGMLPVISPAPFVGAEPSRELCLDFCQNAPWIVPGRSRAQPADFRQSSGEPSGVVTRTLVNARMQLVTSPRNLIGIHQRQPFAHDLSAVGCSKMAAAAIGVGPHAGRNGRRVTKAVSRSVYVWNRTERRPSST